jgi:L-ribulose-5-phosphate 3-epimerase
MNNTFTRRQFIKGTAAAGLLSLMPHSPATAAPFRYRIRKAMIVAEVTPQAMEPLKEAGFEGVETTHVCSESEAKKGRAVAEKLGMKVHSVLRGWMDFNSSDPGKVEDSIEKTRYSLRAAKAYGADAILLVPCRVEGIPMPEAWDFKIDFDSKTGHVTRVVAGDNEPFATYIKAQNKATDMTKAAVEKIIPLAEELKVIIAIENVWNNLWVKPDLFRHFIASFSHPWVKAYFDIGNHVKYAPPQDWVRALGPLIVKLHVKDFKLNPDGHGGKFVHPRDGSIDWPAVRRALDEVGYDGWGTIEDKGLPLAEFNRRFDLIEAGE